MKCSAILSALIVVASAQAATLSLQWQSQPNVDKITLAPSMTAVIDVVLEFSPSGNDAVLGLFFPLEAGPFTHVSNSTAVPGWDAASDPNEQVDLPFGLSQFAVGTPKLSDVVSGTGSLVVGSFSFHFDHTVAPIGSEFPVAFGDPRISQIVKPNGQFFTLTADESLAAYSGYWTYGKGSPGLTLMSNSVPRDPLIVTFFPEPTSLALLGIAAMALVARRGAH